MKTKLFTASTWMFTHRFQLQLALFVVVLGLTLVALFATGSFVSADQMVGGGH
jgi:hypothetical protein